MTTKDDVRRVVKSTDIHGDIIWILDTEEGTHAMMPWEYHEEREADLQTLDEMCAEYGKISDKCFAQEEEIERLRSVPFECGPDGEPNEPCLGAYVDLEEDRDRLRKAIRRHRLRVLKTSSPTHESTEEQGYADAELWRALEVNRDA